MSIQWTLDKIDKKTLRSGLTGLRGVTDPYLYKKMKNIKHCQKLSKHCLLAFDLFFIDEASLK